MNRCCILANGSSCVSMFVCLYYWKVTCEWPFCAKLALSWNTPNVCLLVSLYALAIASCWWSVYCTVWFSPVCLQRCQPEPLYGPQVKAHYITATMTPDTQTQGALSQTTAGDTSPTACVHACVSVCEERQRVMGTRCSECVLSDSSGWTFLSL